MPTFKVHFDKVGGTCRAVQTEAATAESAIARVRHEILLCLPDGTSREDFDVQFHNFRCEVQRAESTEVGV
jgi:hypothetical protein